MWQCGRPCGRPGMGSSARGSGGTALCLGLSGSESSQWQRGCTVPRESRGKTPRASQWSLGTPRSFICKWGAGPVAGSEAMRRSLALALGPGDEPGLICRTRHSPHQKSKEISARGNVSTQTHICALAGSVPASINMSRLRHGRGCRPFPPLVSCLPSHTQEAGRGAGRPGSRQAGG